MTKTFKETITREITFTTGRKQKPRTTVNISRKGSIVKERCRQLSDLALEMFPNRRISHKDLTYLVTTYIGGNKETVRAYLGYKGHVRHSTSGGSSRVVGEQHKGYLEIFGFMHPLKHHYSTWTIHAQTQLVSPAPPLSLINEGYRQVGGDSKEKISISLQQDTDGLKSREVWREERERERDITEKERNFAPMNLGKTESTTDENLQFLEKLARHAGIKEGS